GCLRCFVALSRRFVGLLLGGNGALFSRLVSRAFALLGIGARFDRLLLCRVARLIDIRHHLIVRGRQFGVSLLSVPGGGRVNLGGLAERVTALDKRCATLLELRITQELADGRVERSKETFI